MSEKPRSERTFAWLCALAAPLLLAHCGGVSSSNGVHAGAAGAATDIGAAGALAGAIDAGGSTSSAANAGAANAGTTSGGAAGESGEAAVAGQATAGAADAIAGAGGDSDGAAGSGACAEELLTFSSPSAQHVAVCSAIAYPMNPPVYGDHYPVWAAYKSYSFPVPLGFLVHDLEHGAVELLYNCPQGCADEVATAQAFLDALPQDPRCTDVKHQTILAPDPSLPTRWAAVAWGRSLTAACFDSTAFRSFYDANVGHGPEDICSDGADLASDTCL
jgi:hypothetical protein